MKRRPINQIIYAACLMLSVMHVSAAEFEAYYTKLDSGEAFEKYSRTGPQADIVVRNIGQESGRLVFWRGSSYLPYWEVSGKNTVRIKTSDLKNRFGWELDDWHKLAFIELCSAATCEVPAE